MIRGWSRAARPYPLERADLRARATPFVAMAGVGALLAFAPVGGETDVATAVLGVVATAAVVVVAAIVPWARLPLWCQAVPPLAYFGVVLCLRDAFGASSGFSPLVLVPLLWMALYHPPRQTVVAIVTLATVLVGPVLVVGAPTYPATEWRLAAMWVLAGGMVAIEAHRLVGHLARRERRALNEAGEFRAVLRAATGNAIVAAGPDGVVTLFNEGAERMLGYTADEVVGRVTVDVFHDRAELAARAAELRVEPGPAAIVGDVVDTDARTRDWTYLAKDGHRVPVAVTVTAMLDDDGERVGFMTVAADQTERRRAEALLAATRQQLGSVVDAAPVVVFALDRDGAVTLLQGSGLAALGIGQDRIQGQSIFELFGDEPDVLDKLQRALAGHALSVTMRVRGRHLHVSCSPLRDVLGRPSGVSGVAVDITDRHRAEDALREAKERFARAFDHAPIGMATIDLTAGETGRLLQVNTALVEMLGYAPGFLTGRRLVDFAHVDDRAAARDDLDAMASGHTDHVVGEHRHVRADGGVIWVLATASVVNDDRGRPTVAVAQLADVTARKEAEARLTRQALHDALTGLPNRLLLTDRLDHALAKVARRPRSVAVMFVDLDRFKEVNDGLGHAAGDELLAVVAARLTAELRPGDTVARVGGDEFVVLVEDLDGDAHVVRVAERLAAAVAEPLDLGGRQVTVTASIGICVPGEHDTAEGALRHADAAMYRAKEGGRARHELFDDAVALHAAQRVATEAGLRSAVDLGELVLHYQPQVDLVTGGAVGVEALLRWRHPERGLLSPAAFLDDAEDSGLIVPIGEWVLRAALAQGAAWRADHPHLVGLQLAVNLSARQLAQADIVDVVSDALAATGTAPALLTLELTETTALHVGGSWGRMLDRLRDLGVRISIDDFGTGFASLDRLRDLDVDELKLDRSFVAAMGDDDRSRRIVDAVVGLAGSLGVPLVAEGVERWDQVEHLRLVGCPLAQGFHFARPAPAAALARVLAADHRFEVEPAATRQVS